MNQYDPEKSQIITKQNEEITHWHNQFRVWNTPNVKSAEKWMLFPSDWRFKQCCIHPPTKDTMVPMGTGTGTTTIVRVSNNTRICFLGSRRKLSPCCFRTPLFYSYFTQFQLFSMTFVSKMYLFAAPKWRLINLFLFSDIFSTMVKNYKGSRC